MKIKSTLKAMALSAMLLTGAGSAWADELPAPVYFNDFSSQEGVTIVGNGAFEDDADARFGKVFHNDPALTKAMRTNYLLLPEDVLSHSADSKEMTISFWVNAKNAADYWFSPIFSAYGMSPAANMEQFAWDNAANAVSTTVKREGNNENWPVFVLQSRGLAQINNGGFCDFAKEQNDNAENAENTYWLDDKAWHYYTVTLTTTKVVVYIDGNIFNSWTLDPTVGGQQIEGFFTYGSNYKHICLGGNQAWAWGDPDPAYAFDDFAVYDKALTADQIKQVIAQKSEATFDFTSQTIRENIGTAMNDTKGWIYNETFTVKDVTMQVTCGSAASRIYVDANRGQNLVTYKEYTTLTFKAPQGLAITKIEFTAAGNSNINNFTASSGTIEGMTWTGNAEGVRFQQGGTTYLANAVVTLAAKEETTTSLPDITYTECANIAAFNALEAGTYAKVTLTDAEVIGKSADGYSTVWIQDATGGCWIQYTSLNDMLQEGTKVNGFVYTVARANAGNVHMKEAEATLESSITASEISNYTIVEGTLAEVNVAANLNKVVKISGATLEETSATAGKLTLGDATIDVNNGTATANQQLHKIAEWAKDTKLENVTIVAILVAKSASANQLLPISMEVVETPDAAFDFQNNNGNWPVGEGADYENGNFTTLTQGDVTLTGIQGSAYNPSRIMKNDSRGIYLQCFKENSLKLAAPEGKAIVKVAVTMQTGSFDLTPSTGEVADNVWTGNATEVTFANEKGSRYIWAINVFLADENDETVKPAAAVEVATIAAFNALENGTLAKLTLTNARVNGYYDLRGTYYVEDATGAVAIKGVTLTAGKALSGYIVGTKSADTSVDMNGTIVEYSLTADNADNVETADATLEGTVLAVDAVGTQANYGKLITVENVTISGSAQNKTLTDGNSNTIKARDLMGVLPTDYAWPEKAAKLTGILVYNVTDWFLMPVSADAIVAETGTGIASVSAESAAGMQIFNMQGVRRSQLQRGLNIVNGRKVVVK